jgi:hypothetical protein
MEAIIKAGQEQTKAKTKAKAVKSETNRGMTEAVAEYYEGVQHVNMSMLPCRTGLPMHGPTFKNRLWMCLECNNGIRDRGIK